MLKKLLTWLPPVRRLRDRRDALERELADATGRIRLLEQERDGLAVKLTTAEREVPRLVRLHRPARTFPALSPEQVADYRRRIAEYNDTPRSGTRWYYSMDLGNGLTTDGVCAAADLQRRLDFLHLPADLTGLTVLDIAAWDGFHAFEAEARGAARVVATDYFCWRGDGWGKKAGFDLAREILQSRVEDREIEVHDISPATVGTFDVVLFAGIFYHMRDPIRALEAAASVTRKLLIVETHIGFAGEPRPVMGYLPRVEVNRQSNYWRPNPPLVRQLLTEFGFTDIDERTHWRDPPADSTGFWNAYR